jgi:hypothetical protein
MNMSENNLKLVSAYYRAMNEKNLAGIEKCLHPEILFIGPLAEMAGKDAVLESVKRFFLIFNKLTVRSKLGSEDQAMVVYDLDCPAPIELFRAAAFMTFKDNLIARLELFYDARPFEKKKEQIFSQS